MKLLELARLAPMRISSGGAAPTTRRRKRAALAVAGLVDLVQLVFAPLFVEGALSPFDGVLDVIAAVVLLLVLGRRWRIALALGLELIPGAALFPTWTAVVVTLPASSPPVESPSSTAKSAPT
jgi:hypothetical protein